MNMSADGTLPMPYLAKPTLTDGFTASVDGLMHSLPLLAASGANHLRALSLVAGLIVECTLKAFLSHKGMTEKELSDRRKFGHNLEALWLEAVRRGLPISAPAPDWCLELNELHFQVDRSGGPGPAKHQLRYQTEYHGLRHANTEDLAKQVPLLVEEVRRALRQP